jgi:hypothetical protein
MGMYGNRGNALFYDNERWFALWQIIKLKW